MTDLYNSIFRAKNEYDEAVRSGNGLHGKRNALANVLFNNVEDIMADMTKVAEFDKERERYISDIAALNAALEESDKELAKMRSTRKKAE